MSEEVTDTLIPDAQPASTEPTEPSTPSEPTPNAQPASQVEATFLYADGIAGEGDAPEWFKADKYKSISEQAKGYSELESKFGSFTGAPKDGKYEIEGVSFEDNPLMDVVAKWGADQQLSNDGMAALFKEVDTLAQAQIAEDKAAVKEQLGKDADTRLATIGQWGANNLEAEEFTALKGLIQTAAQVELVENLIGMTKNSKLVTEPVVQVDKAAVEKELKDMQLAVNDKGQRLMDVDPAHAKKVNAKMKEFYGS